MLAFLYRGHKEPGFFVHALTAHARAKLLEPLPGNQRADEARYVCIVPVPNLRPIAERGGGFGHYMDIEPEVVADVQAGRAVILLDMCNAGPDFAPAAFEALYDWIELNDLPAGRVIWLAGNRAIADRARLLAGMRANLVRFMYFDFFVHAMAWSFSPWANAPALGRDPDAAIAAQLNQAAKDRLVLCLNATPRMHRVLAVAALQHHGLIAASIVSFPGPAAESDRTTSLAVERFLEAHPALAYLRPAIAAVRGFPDMRVDAFPERGKALFARIDPAAYARSRFSLVTESDFSDGRCDRVTEKLAKAFCMGHPALVIGNPHAVKFMTDLGFQDWNTVLDRAAEAILDPAERFAAVLREVLRQVESLRTDPAAWAARIAEVSAFNIRHAMTGGLMNAYVATHDAKVIARLRALVAA